MGVSMWAFLLFCLVVIVTHFLEGITGFGCTVMAMPFGIMLLGIEAARPVLTLYGFLLAAYVVVISFRQIQWKHFFKMMGALILGLPLGILLYNYMSKEVLQKVLGVFMILVAARGLLLCFGKIKAKGFRDIVGLTCAFFGGIIHGAFASGGPLTIIYAAEKLRDKSQFRATLCMVWFTLNGIMLAQILLAGQFTPPITSLSLWGIPALVAGTLIGNWAHEKIADTYFSKVIYAVLLLSGCIMLL